MEKWECRMRLFLLSILFSFNVFAGTSSDYQPSKDELRRCEGTKVAPCTIYPLPLKHRFGDDREVKLSFQCSIGKSSSCRRLAEYYPRVQLAMKLNLRDQIQTYMTLACYHGDTGACIEASKLADMQGDHYEATNLGMLACERTKAKNICVFYQYRRENPDKVKNILINGFNG